MRSAAEGYSEETKATAKMVMIFLWPVALGVSYLLKEFIILKGIHEGWWRGSVAWHSFWFYALQTWFWLSSYWLVTGTATEHLARITTNTTLNTFESFQLVFKTIIGFDHSSGCLFFARSWIFKVGEFLPHLVRNFRWHPSSRLYECFNFFLPPIVGFRRGRWGRTRCWRRGRLCGDGCWGHGAGGSGVWKRGWPITKDNKY